MVRVHNSEQGGQGQNIRGKRMTPQSAHPHRRPQCGFFHGDDRRREQNRVRPAHPSFDPSALAAADAALRSDKGHQFDDHVRLEQTQHLYGQLERSTAGMMIAGGIVVFAMWGEVRSPWLLAWLCAIAINQAWRYALYMKFTRDPPP